jgi:hypothetical protein
MSLYSPEQRTTFLGTLASGHPGGDVLPDEFLALVVTFDDLYSLYETRQITREQLAAQLRKLRVVDHDDFEWTIGATTRAWYRRAVDGKWITAPPPMTSQRRSSAPVDDTDIATDDASAITTATDDATDITATTAGTSTAGSPKTPPLLLDDLDDESAPDAPPVQRPAYGT